MNSGDEFRGQFTYLLEFRVNCGDVNSVRIPGTVYLSISLKAELVVNSGDSLLIYCDNSADSLLIYKPQG